ncbi:YebG family protein [uncultured Thiocystis sp.]|jgi:dsDNA-binding SOS-regulon protein|uniref:YebG family protein n=1 Tax=uncultured Thiocystis sp. TaxID=1202134 RepID=UPI0025E0DA06|nr:YebG family protein [uncultured Thiocystis sp.]
MIEIEYIVKDSNGNERLRTADKKVADAYDRVLENAERLAQLLRADQVLPSLPDADLEELTLYLARNAQNVERVLKGKAPEREAVDADPSPANRANNVAPIKAAG